MSRSPSGALHNSKNGRAFSDHFKNVSGQYYGTLGLAFIEVCNRINKTSIKTQLTTFLLKAYHGIEHRAATSLALALPGEIATEYGNQLGRKRSTQC